MKLGNDTCNFSKFIRDIIDKIMINYKMYNGKTILSEIKTTVK